ncbi:MAG TPA: glycosyltransferase [Candidatus Methanoculleus thermohydrogenotrophicum]|jgi:glycosyltransferase involved in cell wall biosynthesis|nr:glycosyltransferase [Candidatus Methanoculleus thermohydrogenotrophicum]NLM82884.1 glycosyltransferase [Candidatus Methanoculleus thermohydrogenotrophicum]HOB17892.1 glycosyltransferase [Candidatus Methanoculleus thermohydrogenotrophicum]HPZ38027.1 glycosyltransferase [Candidatus Methanoculleus thermohydrogenotrophicum]HQC91279.1 glycosyltransferase [Candidatus Methanoculleus thermohydrogenotrophicum]
MISIVIPTYNEEQNIERCLRSLADQTVPRETYEVIVVDGNSKDRTRELAAPLADAVFIQKSKRVGGARNDGIMAARGEIVATTDADCILPQDWVERIGRNFAEREIVQLYGTVYPIEGGFWNRLSLAGANTFSRIGYHTRTIYFTLGCNTAFDRDAFIRAGMYRCIDAGDDLEIAQRMRKLGRVYLDPDLTVGFSMRRYQQFGTLKSISEWLYIVLRGGDASGVTYSQREYR